MTNDDPPRRHVIFSGCSGSGKSTLLAEMARRGFVVVAEQGRRIVEEEMRNSGRALPWIDAAAFARRALELARSDRRSIERAAGWIFFDRGLVDAAVAWLHATGASIAKTLKDDARFHSQVFLTAPWAEIFATDRERRHDFTEAQAEYERLHAAYIALGYDIILLPKVSVRERADFVLRHLS